MELISPTIDDDRTNQGLLCGHTLSTAERSFVLQLLAPQLYKELIRKTPATLANMETPPNQIPDAINILQSVKEPLDNLSLRNRVGLSTVLADPDITTSRYIHVILVIPVYIHVILVILVMPTVHVHVIA